MTLARTPTDIRSLARSHDAMAIRVLAGIARQKAAPPAARVAACRELLDRGHGKAEQSQDFNANVQVTIRKLLDLPDTKRVVDVTPRRVEGGDPVTVVEDPGGQSGWDSGAGGPTTAPKNRKS